jgi:predicted ABC-type transport system involved in lysophospholipase L1 biosynthesis ATPase subunit
MDVLLDAVAHHGTALVMVTHNEALAARMDAQATLHQGSLLYYT